jgi:hypothetical protein
MVVVVVAVVAVSVHCLFNDAVTSSDHRVEQLDDK